MRFTISRCHRMRLLAGAAFVPLFAAQIAAGQAQTANLTPANVNVLNLLSPFLSLNSTAIGQQTLQTNLATAMSLNNNSTLALQQLAISDKNILSNASNTVTNGVTAIAGKYGVAANLAGGIPNQAPPAGTTIVPQQSIGGLGAQLGLFYTNAVNSQANGVSQPLANTTALLSQAYNNLTSPEVGSKNYFANGTTNGTIVAVAPAGYTLPTFNGLPNTTSSVYDIAYGVTNTGPNQNIYGDSRPAQVVNPTNPNSQYTINGFDPTALTGISTNPAFPSGHTNYAYTDSILIGMLVPSEFQGMLNRANSYANSRIVLGVHYPLDIIASRSFAQYDLAQGFTNPNYISNPGYTGSYSATSPSSINLPSLFNAANSEITGYLTTQAQSSGCGATVAACAASAANNANNPYTNTAANLASYTANLTYGLPTLSFTAAPREAAPTGGPDASILLATLYGGSTTAAKTIAPTGGIYGNLSTATINQIVVNTETNALAAFYGTSLSYWSRINLVAASDYFMGGSDGYGGTFTGTSGTLYLAPTDQLTTNVTVGSGSVFGGNGTITGNTTVLSGGTLTPAVSANNVATNAGTLTINGNLTFNSGSTYGVMIGSSGSSSTQVSGTATLGGATVAPTVVAGTTVRNKYTILTANSIAGTFGVVSNAALPALSGSVSYDAKNAYLSFAYNPAATGSATANQAAVGRGINTAFQTIGGLPTQYAALSGQSLSQAAGELGTASHTAAFGTMDAFVASFTGGLSDPGAVDGRGSSGMVSYYADPKPKLQKTAAAEAIDQQLFKPYWTVWTQTFGGTEHIGGNAGTGASASDTQNLGQLIAAEYRLAKDTSVGAAVAGGGQWFSLANGMGSGKAGFGQLALFGTHTFDNLYVSGTVAGGFDSMTTDRTVVGPFGANSLHGSFTATMLTARGEIGNRFKTDFATITPYAAVQSTALYLPSFTETSTSGGGSLYALSYSSKTVGDTKSELGAKVSRTFALSDAQTLTLSTRLAWQHDFNPNQTAQATFVDLPGSTFTVAGAKPSANAALVNTAARVDIGKGVSLEAGFDGAFAANNQVYAGHGRVSYRW